MAWKYQPKGFSPNKAGQTEEEREKILHALYEHMMEGHSLRFFPMHSHQTIARLKSEHIDFKHSVDEIIRMANCHMEKKPIAKVNDPDYKLDLAAFNRLMKTRKGWREEPEKTEVKAQAIKIEMVTSRKQADAFRKDNSGMDG